MTRTGCRRFRMLLFVLFLLVCATASRRAAALPAHAARYDVTVSDPADRTLHVAITLVRQTAGPVRLAIPVWTPGYYVILNFQRDISGFQAADVRGHKRAINRPDDQTWEINAAAGELRITYDVSARDAGFGFFRSHLDEKTGYLNGASALMYVVGDKEQQATIALHLPHGWRTACSLAPAGNNTFRAADYDELIDGPIQMGDFERLDFPVRDVPFSAILVGQSPVDRAALKDTIARIGAAAIDLMGSAPFKRYLFILHFAVGNFGGGLEHRGACVLNLPGRRQAGPHPWAALIAHEYFHAWNVKRIRPVGLGPFDYTQKVRSNSIWFAEGVTDYYSAVLLRLAGITTSDDFLDDMAGRISELQRNDARLRVTAEEASRRAWEGGSMGFGGLNYYNKGSLLGLLFDIEIRSATGNAHSLDDVMRLLDERFGRRGRGYPEDAILAAIIEVSGRDLSDLYQRYVRATAEIPWEEVLNLAGLTLGGDTGEPYLGISMQEGGGADVVVASVEDGSPAARAGIRPNDVLLSVNGKPISMADVRKELDVLRPGDSAVVGVRRGSQVTDIPVIVGSRSPSRSSILLIHDATEAETQVRTGLLRMAQSAVM